MKTNPHDDDNEPRYTAKDMRRAYLDGVADGKAELELLRLLDPPKPDGLRFEKFVKGMK